jgi:exopolysaccharide biosynthesis WecB/TagA/CpsF family protein
VSATQPILGIRFFDGTVEGAVDLMLRQGGLLVVPAAPALVDVRYDSGYREALMAADLAIPDSGAMVLLWRLASGKRIKRISGLAYLKRLLNELVRRPTARILFVVPSEAAKEKTEAWMAGKMANESATCYVAPRYGSPVTDETLVTKLKATRPEHVIIGVGGGVQEKLGLYLRENLDYRPAIHCIGAALGFLTGDQKPIPDWADRMYLGWFLRMARNPRLYLRRFWAAHELPGLIFHCGENLPPMKTLKK